MNNQQTFFFYDLETSGIDARKHRIMQFAGQRTNLELKPIGDPINILVTLSDEILPDPSAIMVTGITPQKTREEGYSEADFLKILQTKVFLPGTIVTGFNSVRFDDEFMRFTLFRNFYDPYEWQWKDGCSRWDLLDVVRMTRALRPDGIEWPFDANGGPTNRLELLSKVNNLDHANAHDALSDVYALIAVAELIKNKQPRIFEHLLKVRTKQEVSQLVDSGKPFVYSSGRYPKQTGHTTVAQVLAEGGKPGSVVVYDLRYDPAIWADKTVDELKALRFATSEMRKQPGFLALPVKELSYNKCPAVAPLGVLDDASQKRLEIDLAQINRNSLALRESGLDVKFRQVFAREAYPKSTDVDAQLYDGFLNAKDKPKMSVVRAAKANDLADFQPDFVDERLDKLLPRYKARNYPQSLSQSERETWELYRSERIAQDLPNFNKQMQALALDKSDKSQFLMQELQLWAESIIPVND